VNCFETFFGNCFKNGFFLCEGPLTVAGPKARSDYPLTGVPINCTLGLLASLLRRVFVVSLNWIVCLWCMVCGVRMWMDYMDVGHSVCTVHGHVVKCSR